MGWWNATREGASLQVEETGLVWGDGPADILDNALDEIRAEFRRGMEREPTVGEIRAGLSFSLAGRTDDEILTEAD